MGQSFLMGCGVQHRRYFVAVLGAFLLGTLPVIGSAAQAAGDAASKSQTAPATSAADTESTLSKITIEGVKQQELRHRVDRFVTSVVTPPLSHESLLRWNKPVCPLVVGLPRDWGELILGRISQAARDAHAPLAGTHCDPNLFVVVTDNPHSVLEQWMARHPRVDTQHGMAPLRSFLNSTQPIRVWYNSEPGCAGPVSHGSSAAELGSVLVPGPSDVPGSSGGASPGTGLGPVHCQNSIDTHLTYGEVRTISYAIVVADTNQLRVKHVTLGQLAGYVSLVGLADVQSDTDGGGMPTILRLFRDTKPPAGLTRWDRALLYSLYNTSQSGRLQLTDMEVTMVRQIAR